VKEIVVISGKGGTGKTTITAALASLWKNKVIADCDVDAADLHLILHPDIVQKQDFFSGKEPVIDFDKCTQCGKCREICVYDAIASDFTISRSDCEGCAVCFHFCPVQAIELKDRHCGEWHLSETRFGPMVHARLGIAEENSGKLVALIRKQAKATAENRNCDIILIDGSPGIGCPVISSITGASLVIAVTEPTISGMHDLNRVLSLARHFQVPAEVIINKADLNPEMCREIESAAEQQSVPILGSIPYDDVVTRAMVVGKTVIEFEDGEVTKTIRSISDKILSMI
jgi:MinD superfamily P-loop ATPase